MSLSTEAQTILRSIRARVDNGEWMQGLYHSSNNTRHCLVGFIQDETMVRRSLTPTRYEVDAALGKAIKRHSGCYVEITSWNDRKGRTKEEVVQLIDDALLHGTD